MADELGFHTGVTGLPPSCHQDLALLPPPPEDSCSLEVIVLSSIHPFSPHFAIFSILPHRMVSLLESTILPSSPELPEGKILF